MQVVIIVMYALISIHALLAESDTIFAVRPYDAPIFLSTLSLRRATSSMEDLEPSTTHFYPRSPCGERQCTPWNSPTLCYFYPRSPCGERQQAKALKVSPLRISIHALLAESDMLREPTTSRNNKFLSTLSLRRATRPIDVPQ